MTEQLSKIHISKIYAKAHIKKYTNREILDQRYICIHEFSNYHIHINGP